VGSAPVHEHEWGRVDPRLRIDRALEIEGIVDGAGLAPGWPISSASGGNVLGSSLMSRAFLKEHDVSLRIAYACWVSMWLSSDLRLPTAWVTRTRCSIYSKRPVRKV
jgi:hypothetical protein